MVVQNVQPVILAAGKGTRMPEVTANQPKCLVMIGNKPMIQYSLEMLIRANFKVASMFVLKEEEEVIRSAITKLGLDIVIDYLLVDARGDTADNFRGVKSRNKLTKDLLIISCDIVTDYDLRPFLRFYHEKDPTLMCLFSSIPSVKEDLAPARKFNNNHEYDLVGFDKTNQNKIAKPGNLDGDEDVEVPDNLNRMAFFEPDAKYPDGILFKKKFLRKVPVMELHTDYQDCHVYIMKHWLLDYLVKKPKIASIKSDLVPSLVRKQFRKLNVSVKIDDSVGENGENVFERCFELDDITEAMNKLEIVGLNEFEEDFGLKKNPVKCYAMVADKGFCLRTNSTLRFCEANRIMLKNFTVRIPKTEKVKSFVDGFLGHDSAVGEKCSIKKSVIGANCQIGNSVTLLNCILLDKVQIHDGAQLKNCLICAGTVVEKECVLVDSIVGSNETIQTNLTNEMIVNMDYGN